MSVLSAYVHSLFAGGHVAIRQAVQPDDWQSALQAAYAEGARHVLLDAGFEPIAEDALQALLAPLPPGIYLTAAALHVRPHGWWPQVGLVDGAPHLFRADIAPAPGAASGSGPAPLPVQRRRGRPRKHPLPSGLSSSAQDSAPDSLGEYLEHAWTRLGTHDRDILQARLGVDGEPRTLEQIAQLRVPEVSRERIRQLEQRALKTLRELPASAHLLRRLRTLIRSDQPLLSLDQLPQRDPWFDHTASQAWFEKLLRALAEGEIDTIDAGGRAVLVPFPLAHWQQCVQQARSLLHRLSSEDCLLSQAAEQVGKLLEERHAAFRPLLWQAAGGDQVQSAQDPDGQQRVVAMGQGAKELVKVILFEATEPLHRDQVVQLVRARTARDISDMSITNALPDVGVLMARGHYGLRRHLPYSDDQVQALVAAAEAVVLHAPAARQWSTEEICRAVRDDGLFDAEQLDPYLLGACLRLHGTRLIDLKKGVWEPADGALGERIMIRDFIVELLQEMGRPLSTEELKNALRERRGLAATFQIQPRDPLVRLGKAVWGLIDRDLPVPVKDLGAYVDELHRHLLRSSEGLHVSEVLGVLAQAGLDVGWVEDPELFFALAQRRDDMRVTPARYLALSQWTDERRLTPTAAIRQAVSADPMRPAAAIAADASARARREIGVDAVRYILNNCDYTFDRASGSWCRAGSDTATV